MEGIFKYRISKQRGPVVCVYWKPHLEKPVSWEPIINVLCFNQLIWDYINSTTCSFYPGAEQLFDHFFPIPTNDAIYLLSSGVNGGSVTLFHKTGPCTYAFRRSTKCLCCFKLTNLAMESDMKHKLTLRGPSHWCSGEAKSPIGLLTSQSAEPLYSSFMHLKIFS